MKNHLWHKMIEDGFEPITPGNPKIKELLRHSERSLAIYKLPRAKGLCKWCFVNKTPSPRHFYCSEGCKLSVEIFCYPQKVWSRQYILRRQKDRCVHCGYNFTERTKLKFNDLIDEGEVDHIIPIHKGGVALGWENLQILCRECHMKKSVQERKRG